MILISFIIFVNIDTAEADSGKPKIVTKTVILPDGSYGTQTIVVDDAS